MATFTGVNFNNLRKALFLLYFGARNGECDDFNSPLYKYIIPMQGNFDNPLQMREKDTFIEYWIEKDEMLTQDDFVERRNGDIYAYNRQKCVASILLRFIGKDAENWVKVFRHLAKREGVTDIWSGVMDAEKLEYTAPVIPRRIDYSGSNSTVAFDIRFKLYYDELLATSWQPLEGIDFTFDGHIVVDDTK